MEDTRLAVFDRDPGQQVFCKLILDRCEAARLRSDIEAMAPAQPADGGLANGRREMREVRSADLPELCARLGTVLRDYFPDLSIGDRARLYRQDYGGVRPHSDASLDARSAYTLILYLDDACEGGALSIRAERVPAEREARGNPERRHKVYRIRPRTGYGVVFRKTLLHWADEVTDGCKTILLLDLASAF